MSIFSNVYNFQNNKVTYARSSGSFCKLRKSKKSKNKLLTVVLPSGINIFIKKITKVYLGKNTNFNVNSLIEGKFGYGFHVYKKINVRGVAMNPVDHPNGGRTKTVQPERSP
jgi:ribosomal protein L2